MKRHPALRALSSDHHQGLVQARRLIKVAGLSNGEDSEGAAQVAKVVSEFLAFWAEHTSLHFREEEEVLLPAFARYGNPSVGPVVQMLVEHAHIRRLVADLQSQVAVGQPSKETIHTTGEMLRAHIRHEEDVVFPMIEQAMPEDALQALAVDLA